MVLLIQRRWCVITHGVSISSDGSVRYLHSVRCLRKKSDQLWKVEEEDVAPSAAGR